VRRQREWVRENGSLRRTTPQEKAFEQRELQERWREAELTPILPAMAGTSAAIITCCTAAYLPRIALMPSPVYKPLNNFSRSDRSPFPK
jgi:hypothetical protein